MPSDVRITPKILVDNNAFSAKHFLPHAIYLFSNQPKDMDVDVWRYKVVFTNKGSGSSPKLILKCHYQGRSNRHATVLDYETRKELITFSCNVAPKAFLDIMNVLLAS